MTAMCEDLSEAPTDFFIKVHLEEVSVRMIKGMRFKRNEGNSSPWRFVSCQTSPQASTDTLKKTQDSSGEFHWNKKPVKVTTETELVVSLTD